MDKKAKLLWAWAKAQIRERVEDERSAMLLLQALERKAKRAPLRVARKGRRTFVQFAATPLPPGAEKLRQKDARADYTFMGRTETFQAGDLRWVLLAELARRLPPWARGKVHHGSDAAQKVADMLAGLERSVVRVDVTIEEE